MMSNYLTVVLNVGKSLGASSPVPHQTDLLHFPTLQEVNTASVTEGQYLIPRPHSSEQGWELHRSGLTSGISRTSS